MDHEISPGQLVETLGQLSRHWDDKRKVADRQSGLVPPAPQALTIALSREAGTQGTAVGQEVGLRLGWPVYDYALLEKISRDMGVRTSLLESVDERRISWLKEALDSLFDVPSVNDMAYVHHLAKTILALGAHGECVIVGRGSAFILPAETTLRVRLMASLKDRIAMFSERRGVSREEAARQVDAMDREHNRFVQEHFFKDPSDLRQYHLVLDVARFGVAGCAELIVAGLECLKAQTIGGSGQSVPAHKS